MKLTDHGIIDKHEIEKRNGELPVREVLTNYVQVVNSFIEVLQTDTMPTFLVGIWYLEGSKSWASGSDIVPAAVRVTCPQSNPSISPQPKTTPLVHEPSKLASGHCIKLYNPTVRLTYKDPGIEAARKSKYFAHSQGSMDCMRMQWSNARIIDVGEELSVVGSCYILDLGGFVVWALYSELRIT
jgi:hypothetical protein